MNNIPKLIHYCWFGKNPLPALAKKCIASWIKYFPDYEIKEWNESNYDVKKIPYTMQAYDAKKYAFVSDFARFDILYQYGGVYFDTDVEVIKSLDEILKHGAFAGVEGGGALAAGLGLACPAASPIYKEILDSYKGCNFIKKDGSMDLTTVVTRVSNIFRKHGFTDKNEIQKIAGITVYPVEYFCPKSYITGELKITRNSYTIHHYDASWKTEYDKRVGYKTYEIYKKYGNNNLSKIIVIFYRGFSKIEKFGIKKTLRYYFRKESLWNQK